MLMKSKTKTERESQMLKRAELVLPQGTLGNLPYETIISQVKGAIFGTKVVTNTWIIFLGPAL